MGFGMIDYGIFATTLLISAAIGVYYKFAGDKQKDNQEYLLGGRKQNPIPVAFSLVASFASTISILGMTSESYMYGTHFFVINFSYIASTLVAIAIFLPVFFNNGSVSVYEYLENRFGNVTRIIASLSFSLQSILYMGVVLYAPALAMEAVTGISQIPSIFIVGFVCMFYSVIGGIKAVIFTDLFQTILMFAAVIAVAVAGIVEAGSLSELWKVANEGGRIDFSNFSFDLTERHSWFSVLIGGFLTHISLYAVNQTQVQRCLTTKSLKSASIALLLSLPILVTFTISLCMAGLSMFYKYRKCDPIKQGRIASADQLLPLYVTDTFGNIPGLTGVFVAGMFSASLSTVSAVINSLAAVALEDYIKPIYRKYDPIEIAVHRQAFLSKILSVFFGLVCLIVAMLSRSYSSVLQASLVIFGVAGGPLFAIFTLAVTVPFVHEKGTVAGLVVGLISSAILGFVKKAPSKPLPTSSSCSHLFFNNTVLSQPSENVLDYPFILRISYLYYIVIGFTITVLVSLIVSLITTNQNRQKIRPELFTPFVARILRKKYTCQDAPFSFALTHSKDETL